MLFMYTSITTIFINDYYLILSDITRGCLLLLKLIFTIGSFIVRFITDL
jgi:hypothetical protein